MARLEPQIQQRKRGRKPKTPLLQEVEEAYAHVHDLDWLQECALAGLSEVRGRAQLRQFMPEAQVLRGLLIQAAQQVIQDIEKVPSLAGVRLFLERYLEGNRVSDVAREVGVSREWFSSLPEGGLPDGGDAVHEAYFHRPVTAKCSI